MAKAMSAIPFGRRPSSIWTNCMSGLRAGVYGLACSCRSDFSARSWGSSQRLPRPSQPGQTGSWWWRSGPNDRRARRAAPHGVGEVHHVGHWACLFNHLQRRIPLLERKVGAFRRPPRSLTRKADGFRQPQNARGQVTGRHQGTDGPAAIAEDPAHCRAQQAYELVRIACRGALAWRAVRSAPHRAGPRPGSPLRPSSRVPMAIDAPRERLFEARSIRGIIER